MKPLGRMLLLLRRCWALRLPKEIMAPPPHLILPGFPHHALDTYLHKLVKAGYRVAICDQLEDPKACKRNCKKRCDGNGDSGHYSK